MSKITLNAELAALLEAATTESELVAPDGRRLGLFIPPALAPELEALLEERRRLYDEPTLEQLRAIEAAGGAIPHEEVVKRLGLE
jgi:hypothetical protein